ncbi:MAG TPA: prephenate dehydratase [Pirellulales bacterium]|jgi:chorismate mutase/prephenate dehydratase|nr:prephenate dehydratase [Pirellulales bacterium]
MAKAKPADNKPHKDSPAKAPTLAGLRGQVDHIDRELVQLINQRAKLAHKIGQIKDTSGQPTYDPVREEEVLARTGLLNKGPLCDANLRAVFREIISGSRALEKKMRVAYLGPAYSYSHLAAIHRFGQAVELVGVGNFAAVFEEVNRRHADFGVVPIENSTDGRVADTLDMFTRLPVKICGEVQLRIHHHLLGRCAREEVQEIYSRPQALSQCRNWLAKHHPTARTIEVTSTSTAAQLAQDKPGAAAIASFQAGVHYGLNSLAENIEDNPGNATRFAVIGDHCGTRTGNDKTALMFEIHHRPGALADALGVFKRNRLNLTWIESFPIPQSDGGYLFFVELEGHQTDKRLQRAIEQVGRRSVRLVVLGSYARTAPVD